MVFSSVAFLFVFLPATLGAYFAFPKLRNWVLTTASLIFYLWGGGVFVLILLASVFVDFFFGKMAQSAVDSGNQTKKRLAVTGSVVLNIGLLAYFKYANFFVTELNLLADGFGWGTIAWTNVTLPIGISFFTFQSMSYTIDVARGEARHLRNLRDFALYVALFPQLIAGPIVRYHEVATQLTDRSSTSQDVARGLLRFAHGLVKKVLVADAVATVADAAFGLPTDQLTAMAAWAGVVAYTIQIYFDFSGYSDMAIGLGLVFGFTFPENFARPYSASSITDFWRRWHITLSNWFRDYVYIPLGGSRGSFGATYFNLILVFFITGLWHGANWTFVVWGVYHGALMLFERLAGLRSFDPNPSHKVLRRTVTMLLVMFGWVIFRADSMSHAFDYLTALIPSGDAVPLDRTVAVALNTQAVLMMIVGAAVVFLPPTYRGWRHTFEPKGNLLRTGLVFGLLPLTLIAVLSGSFSPFLYFQF